MAAAIRLKTREFQMFCRLAGLKTDDAKAKAIGVTPATVSRVLRGKTAPGVPFIAGTLTAFAEYEVSFADLFEVETGNDDNDDEAAA